MYSPVLLTAHKLFLRSGLTGWAVVYPVEINYLHAIAFKSARRCCMQGWEELVTLKYPEHQEWI